MKNRRLTSDGGALNGLKALYVEYPELDGFEVPEGYRLFNYQDEGVATNRWYMSGRRSKYPDIIIERVRSFGDKYRVRFAVPSRHQHKEWQSFATVDEAVSTMIARARLGLNEQE